MFKIKAFLCVTMPSQLTRSRPRETTSLIPTSHHSSHPVTHHIPSHITPCHSSHPVTHHILSLITPCHSSHPITRSQIITHPHESFTPTVFSTVFPAFYVINKHSVCRESPTRGPEHLGASRGPQRSGAAPVGGH